MEMMIYQQIKEAICKSRKPMIVSHRKPDGDTLGSALALFLVFKNLNKEAFLFCVDRIEKQFSFIRETVKYSQFKEKAVEFNPDFIFFVDCADLKMGGAEDVRERFPKAKIINIDHHVSNPLYGDVNLINSKASSACEVLHSFLKGSAISVDSKIATMLFLGIFTDTNNFSNAATSPQALFAAAELWQRGIFISDIKNNLLKNKTISFLKLWGMALGRIKYNEDLNIASTYITNNDLASLGFGGDSLDGLSNFLNANLNVETIAVLKELDGGEIRVSLRTTNDEIDLSKLARVFGGGGHRKASGFSVKGKIEIVGNSWTLRID
jgi:phosphoesterase RecJ-like protein